MITGILFVFAVYIAMAIGWHLRGWADEDRIEGEKAKARYEGIRDTQFPQMRGKWGKP